MAGGMDFLTTGHSYISVYGQVNMKSAVNGQALALIGMLCTQLIIKFNWINHPLSEVPRITGMESQAQ